MKAKWLSSVGIFILLMSVATFLYVTQLKIESGWAEEKQLIVIPNKSWYLTFTEKIDKETINPNTVFVTNDKGEKMDVSLNISEDLKTLTVSPPDMGYEVTAKYYTLHLGKDIQSRMGRSLGSEKEIQFVVQENLPVIGSRQNLNKYFQDIVKEQDRNNLFSVEIMESSKESADSSSNSAGSSSAVQDVSETNIQVEGVDESDIVRTNGSHIYQVVDGKINIIEANNGKNMKILNPITFPDTFYPFQLFLEGDKLLVLGHSYEDLQSTQSKKIAGEMIAPMNEATKAIVYNIANPNNPKEERAVSLEGHLISSRKINNKVYIVTNQFPQYWMMRENEEIDLRPRFSDSSISNENLVVDYDDIHYFPESKEANYTIIAALDLEKPDEKAHITTYLGSGSLMYMSMENLYLAVQDWGVTPLMDGNPDSVQTNLYKFAINDLDVTFHSSTMIEGRILNQFSMDEHNGYFRVATTKGMVWDEGRPSSNNLFIFDENLKAVSSIEDLARGERIYSARFMGDKIYIVTFRETDPLFVIDASEPKEPKLLGELKIPGFSNYLHPYDENHLIGFGHDTKSVPSKDSKEPLILTEGIKISLFDITDMENPKEKFTEVIGGRGTYSPLNYDHKALLFNKDKGIFAFPINVYQSVVGSDFDQKFEFQGAYVYNIDIKEGFKLKSKISHMKGNEPYEEWENEIQRLLYIGDTLYALSNSTISSYSIQDISLKEKLLLK